MYPDFSVFVVVIKISNKRFLLFCLNCLLLISANAFATDDINMENQVALHGYDPVSYFSGRPTPGDETIFTVKDRVKYLFSSQHNKALFDDAPDHYVPMYGGYCAYGVRMGKKLDNDPFVYEIKDDRLYVMLNRATHRIWQQDMSRNIQISDRLWPQIKSKPINSLK